MLGEFDVLTRQKMAADWLQWACGPKQAVDQHDPIYQQVTEGRDKPTKGYSSCGDLGHWILYRLGARLPWVNRAEHLGWRVGKNVSALCWGPAPARDYAPGMKLEAGDIVIIWGRPDGTDAHVMCVVDHDPGARVLCTAEYGQPGGALRNHVYNDDNGGMKFGRRSVHKVLLLKDVIAQADASGDLVEPEALSGFSY